MSETPNDLHIRANATADAWTWAFDLDPREVAIIRKAGGDYVTAYGFRPGDGYEQQRKLRLIELAEQNGATIRTQSPSYSNQHRVVVEAHFNVYAPDEPRPISLSFKVAQALRIVVGLGVFECAVIETQRQLENPRADDKYIANEYLLSHLSGLESLVVEQSKLAQMFIDDIGTIIPLPEIPSKADTLASSAYKRNDRTTRTLNGKMVYRVFLYKTQLRILKRAKTGKYYDERGNVLGSWSLSLFNGGDAGYLICTPDQAVTEWA